MLHLKKYFTEGLIQVAILLSLCGVRVDVGLEPYLPPSWHDMMLGPTSALTQTHFHNLRNRPEDGRGPHAKNVDVDGFFTTRRLLGWVRSLDRLQIPRSELETWLVQREPDPLPMDCQDQGNALLDRVPTGMERDRGDLTAETTAGREALPEEVEDGDREEGTRHVVLHRSGDVDGSEEEDVARTHRRDRRRTTTTGSRDAHFRASTQNELEQECLRLLEETFPFTEDQQLGDGGSRRTDVESQRQDSRESLLSPIISTENPSLDMELRWQDLFAIMEPGNTDVDMTSSFDQAMDSNPSEALNRSRNNNLVNGATGAVPDVRFMESSMQQGFLWSPNQPQRDPALLPLTPSADLDDYNSTLSSGDLLNTAHRPPDPSEPSKEFLLQQNANATSSPLNGNLPTQDLEGDLFPGGDLASLDVNFQLRSLTPTSPVSSVEGSDMNRGLLMTPPSVLLVDEEGDVGDEGYLPDQLGDLLEDAAILEEMRLMDLALEEGFSPEMAARLEEEGYFGREEDDDGDDDGDDDHAVAEEQSQAERQQQDAENEADSDSGLSLNFSYSPASPCASEASYCSSSSSSSSSSASSSTSASSYMSDVGSPFREVKEEDEEEDSFALNMDLDVHIKQEPEDEEEMGAVGGVYPEDFKKLFPGDCDNHKLMNDVHWMEHIEHDHTYNQPRSTISSLDNVPTKHSKSSPQHHNPRPVHYSSSSRFMSEAKIRCRDERRARALKVPFSNELIVNLPVEEFNDLLTNYHLDEHQLALVRDIRRRGKNKIAAQNCRKRKLDVLVGLEDHVSGLRRHRSRLLREKQEALRHLQDMKRRLGALYQDVFARLRDEEGRPLDSTQHFLNFEQDGSVVVASHRQETWTPLRGGKTSKKQRSKKK